MKYFFKIPFVYKRTFLKKTVLIRVYLKAKQNSTIMLKQRRLQGKKRINTRVFRSYSFGITTGIL